MSSPRTLSRARRVPRPGERSDRDEFTVLVGASAVVFSAIYFASDVIELMHGRFSTVQLVLTYIAEAALPFFVLGLFVIQRPQIGRLGFIASVAYAYAFVFFTGTVLYALVDRTSDWATLEEQIGPWVAVHSAVMVVAGVAFGIAVVRAKVLPRCTGITLAAGMVLMTVATVLPDVVQTMSAGVRDLAFAGMGASLLLGNDHHRAVGVRVGGPEQQL